MSPKDTPQMVKTMEVRSDADLQAIQTSVAFKNISDAIEQYRRQFGVAFLALIAFSAIHVGLVVIANLYTMQTRVSHGMLTSSSDATTPVGTASLTHTLDVGYIMLNMNEIQQLAALRNIRETSFTDKEGNFRQYTVTGFQLGGWRRSNLKLYTSVGHVLEYVRGQGVRVLSEDGQTSTNSTDGSGRKLLAKAVAAYSKGGGGGDVDGYSLRFSGDDYGQGMFNTASAVHGQGLETQEKTTGGAGGGISRDVAIQTATVTTAAAVKKELELKRVQKFAYSNLNMQDDRNLAVANQQNLMQAVENWEANKETLSSGTGLKEQFDAFVNSNAFADSIPSSLQGDVNEAISDAYSFIDGSGGWGGIASELSTVLDASSDVGGDASSAMTGALAGAKCGGEKSCSNAQEQLWAQQFMGGAGWRDQYKLTGGEEAAALDSDGWGCTGVTTNELVYEHNDALYWKIQNKCLENQVLGDTLRSDGVSTYADMKRPWVSGQMFSFMLGHVEYFTLYFPPHYCNLDDVDVSQDDIDDLSWKMVPSVIMLHGFMGDAEFLHFLAKALDRVFEHYWKKKTAKGKSGAEGMMATPFGFIVTCPQDGSGPHGKKTWYLNNMFTGFHMDFIAWELRQYVESDTNVYNHNHPHVRNGVFGFSMGGFGSFNLGFTYPSLFSIILDFNGPTDGSDCFYTKTCYVYCLLANFACEVMWTSLGIAYNPYVLIRNNVDLNSPNLLTPMTHGNAVHALVFGITGEVGSYDDMMGADDEREGGEHKFMAAGESFVTCISMAQDTSRVIVPSVYLPRDVHVLPAGKYCSESISNYGAGYDAKLTHYVGRLTTSHLSGAMWGPSGHYGDDDCATRYGCVGFCIEHVAWLNDRYQQFADHSGENRVAIDDIEGSLTIGSKVSMGSASDMHDDFAIGTGETSDESTNLKIFWVNPVYMTMASQYWCPPLNTLNDAPVAECYYNYIISLPLGMVASASESDSFDTTTYPDQWILLSVDAADQYGVFFGAVLFTQEWLYHLTSSWNGGGSGTSHTGDVFMFDYSGEEGHEYCQTDLKKTIATLSDYYFSRLYDKRWQKKMQVAGSPDFQDVLGTTELAYKSEYNGNEFGQQDDATQDTFRDDAKVAKHEDKVKALATKHANMKHLLAGGPPSSMFPPWPGMDSDYACFAGRCFDAIPPPSAALIAWIKHFDCSVAGNFCTAACFTWQFPLSEIYGFFENTTPIDDTTNHPSGLCRLELFMAAAGLDYSLDYNTHSDPEGANFGMPHAPAYGVTYPTRFFSDAAYAAASAHNDASAAESAMSSMECAGAATFTDSDYGFGKTEWGYSKRKLLITMGGDCAVVSEVPAGTILYTAPVGSPNDGTLTQMYLDKVNPGEPLLHFGDDGYLDQEGAEPYGAPVPNPAFRAKTDYKAIWNEYKLYVQGIDLGTQQLETATILCGMVENADAGEATGIFDLGGCGASDGLFNDGQTQCHRFDSAVLRANQLNNPICQAKQEWLGTKWVDQKASEAEVIGKQLENAAKEWKKCSDCVSYQKMYDRSCSVDACKSCGPCASAKAQTEAANKAQEAVITDYFSTKSGESWLKANQACQCLAVGSLWAAVGESKAEVFKTYMALMNPDESGDSDVMYQYQMTGSDGSWVEVDYDDIRAYAAQVAAHELDAAIQNSEFAFDDSCSSSQTVEEQEHAVLQGIFDDFAETREAKDYGDNYGCPKNLYPKQFVHTDTYDHGAEYMCLTAEQMETSQTLLDDAIAMLESARKESADVSDEAEDEMDKMEKEMACYDAKESQAETCQKGVELVAAQCVADCYAGGYPMFDTKAIKDFETMIVDDAKADAKYFHGVYNTLMQAHATGYNARAHANVVAAENCQAPTTWTNYGGTWYKDYMWNGSDLAKKSGLSAGNVALSYVSLDISQSVLDAADAIRADAEDASEVKTSKPDITPHFDHKPSPPTPFKDECANWCNREASRASYYCVDHGDRVAAMQTYDQDWQKATVEGIQQANDAANDAAEEFIKAMGDATVFDQGNNYQALGVVLSTVGASADTEQDAYNKMVAAGACGMQGGGKA